MSKSIFYCSVSPQVSGSGTPVLELSGVIINPDGSLYATPVGGFTTFNQQVSLSYEITAEQVKDAVVPLLQTGYGVSTDLNLKVILVPHFA